MAADKEKLVASSSKAKKLYAGKHVLRLGVTQIVIGCLIIAAQIVVLVVYNIFFNSISHGIWCGFAFVVCGVVGILAGKRGTTCLITGHLVLCILACIFAGAVIAMSALTSVYNYGSPYRYESQPCRSPLLGENSPHDHHDYPNYVPPAPSDDYWGSYYNGYGRQGERYPCYDSRYVINVPWVVQFSMNLLMGVSGIIMAILTVIAATLSCVPLCCDPLKQLEKQDEGNKQLLDVTSQEQEQEEAGPLPVKVIPSDFVVMAVEGSSHI